MRGMLLFVCLSLVAWAAGGREALAERRVALVIGNSAYAHVPALRQPKKDAEAIGGLFTSAGFDHVAVHLDAGIIDMKRAIRSFSDAAQDADVVVVFYAGHGIEVRGTNYLIPVDAKLAASPDVEDETIPLERVIAMVDESSNHKRLGVVILDACRDNPFVKTMKMVGPVGKPSAAQQLFYNNVLLAYAAKAGTVSEDGDADHSVFTQALLRNLTIPGLDIRLAFGRIRDEVLRDTNRKQEPFVYGSLDGALNALVPVSSTPVQTSDDEEKHDYEIVAKIGSVKAWEVFLKVYPNGKLTEAAREQLAKLQGKRGFNAEPCLRKNNDAGLVVKDRDGRGYHPCADVSR